MGREAVNTLFLDIMGNRAANEYAQYLLENQENNEVVAEICNRHNILGQTACIVGNSILDDDEENEEKMLLNEFMDAHGLLTELEDDCKVLLDKKFTHVGIGFAWNKVEVKIVEIYSEKTLTITGLGESEDNGMEIRGQVLADKVGVYAARIVSGKLIKDPKAKGE